MAETTRAETTRAATPRFDTIDLLRGLSILAVVLLHTWLRFWLNDIKVQPPVPPWLAHLLFHNGDYGVTVFFCISGFLITFTSLKRFGSLAQMKAAIFYRIRFARIAPLLMLLLAILSVFAVLHVPGFEINHKKASLLGAVFSALTFHLNWYEAVHGYLPACWDVLWSLSVEEMFYLFFPLACLLLLRWKHGMCVFIAMLTCFVVIGPFARAIWSAYNPIWQEKTYLGGTDAIALGCLTALLTNHLLGRRKVGDKTLLAIQTFGALLILFIALAPRWHWLHPAMRFLGRSALDNDVLMLGTCLVMLCSVLLGTGGSLFTAPIRWFGRHSYEVYLTHEFLVIGGVSLYLHYKKGPITLWYLGILLLTVPLGWLVSHFFFEPLNRKLRGARPPA
ncbi:acyltransferase family protein [Granulicella tundricola]|uniref:Acyltransferase 3 n=1 Tax=Granulicella tundricola (strain ATCC BAA-1859 / DSM 23138 / MP5ACTX9) TaxID=1198114 RepID=E8X3E8_GRATM|nr:acyltransferase [Granulicella tundricola]ADW70449.1 acyltransferase 3 [Granulicella tundricola MP5ACTX9]